MAPRGGDPQPLIILYSADESNMRSLSMRSFQSFWWGRESEELALPVKFTDTNGGRSCSVVVLCECSPTSSRHPLIFEVRGELAVLWKRQDPVLSLSGVHICSSFCQDYSFPKSQPASFPSFISASARISFPLRHFLIFLKNYYYYRSHYLLWCSQQSAYHIGWRSNMGFDSFMFYLSSSLECKFM